MSPLLYATTCPQDCPGTCGDGKSMPISGSEWKPNGLARLVSNSLRVKKRNGHRR